MEKQHVILINGSMNKTSMTRKLLEVIEQKLKHNGHNAEIADVRELALPMFDPGTEPPESVRKLASDIKNADGVIAGSPEYHGSFTGAFKNCIDFLGFPEFENKPVGLVTVTGGIKAGTNTLNHMRLVFRNVHAHVIPQQFAISQKEASPSMELDESLDLRLESFVQGVETEMLKSSLFKNYEESRQL